MGLRICFCLQLELSFLFLISQRPVSFLAWSNVMKTVSYILCRFFFWLFQVKTKKSHCCSIMDRNEIPNCSDSHRMYYLNYFLYICPLLFWKEAHLLTNKQISVNMFLYVILNLSPVQCSGKLGLWYQKHRGRTKEVNSWGSL